jgi:hypothetical protein
MRSSCSSLQQWQQLHCQTTHRCVQHHLCCCNKGVAVKYRGCRACLYCSRERKAWHLGPSSELLAPPHCRLRTARNSHVITPATRLYDSTLVLLYCWHAGMAAVASAAQECLWCLHVDQSVDATSIVWLNW